MRLLNTDTIFYPAYPATERRIGPAVGKTAFVNKTCFHRYMVVPMIVLALSACGGGSGQAPVGPGSTDSLPSGKIRVDGHVFNASPLAQSNGPENVKITYFNADGSVASYHELWEWSGEDPTYLEEWRYAYDAAGKLISEERELTYTREGLANYSHSFTETAYTYYSSGQGVLAGKLSTETTVLTATDTNGDGIYTDGNVGATLEKITHTYDGLGNHLTELRDDQGDNLVTSSNDTTTTFSYDAFGRLSEEAVAYFFGSEHFTYTYDNITNQIVEKKWYYNTTNLTNNDPDEVFTYFYDLSGKIERIEHDYGISNSANPTLDGVSDKTTYYRYGANGDLYEIQIDLILISSKQTIITKYLHEVIDADGNGNPDVVLTYQISSGTIVDLTGGYAPENWGQWVTDTELDINDSDPDDGWSGGWNSQWGNPNCNLCGNIQGEVNSIMMGF